MESEFDFNLNDAMLGVTIVEEVLSIFNKDEILNTDTIDLIDQIDTQNAYEEDWKEWKKTRILDLYVRAIEILKTHLA